MSGRARRRILAIAVVLAPLIAACTEPEVEVAPSEPCRSVVDDVATAVEISEQVALLDTALVVCRSVEQLDRALAAHPGVIAVDASTFADRRCSDAPDARIAGSTICRSVVTTTTTEPVSDEPTLGVYVGRTLDGRDVEILASDTLFTQGRPAAIVQIVDIGTEDGCEGVAEEFRRWSELVDDPEFGDEASVYARHALNVSSNLGCPTPE